MAHLSFCSSLDDTMTNYPHCDCGENPPMPKTSKEKQEDFRARQALLGLREVRGIYLPESLHPALKEYAANLMEKHEGKETKSKPPKCQRCGGEGVIDQTGYGEYRPCPECNSDGSRPVFLSPSY